MSAAHRMQIVCLSRNLFGRRGEGGRVVVGGGLPGGLPPVGAAHGLMQIQHVICWIGIYLFFFEGKAAARGTCLVRCRSLARNPLFCLSFVTVRGRKKK